MSQSNDQQKVEQIINTIQTIKYGSIEITVHDGKIVQIERKEKIRFDKQDNKQ